ncbi:2-aminoethylphosphonate--pyruvate transaminase [Enterococcus sp. SMC-9]|uniref:2-aminoethylphosphonate--pyruvate transaminase n=1 Tax=Enterococcus sp. SMC-9 TaxID=2862343 RepID=UPI001E344F29|nr:2-aminoethylphosphonate--pyruvate transaminase [Enterococcus sp. SMC-9]MCD1024897.1 2-aminoethylphosphonate--pyruvate transaminase [Enterococcus sp. SMC-9]
MEYKLLTPGPLTTTATVKEAMLVDHCTWDDDYKIITQHIRQQLLALAHVSETEYTTILMQGSGSFAVEAVLSSIVGEKDKILICGNGAYGARMQQTAARYGLNHLYYEVAETKIPDATEIATILAADSAINFVAMVHSETTSGIVNDIESVAKVVKAHQATFIVDAMSSFGGIEIPMAEIGIDFLVSSANKCIQGVPGFGFIICRRDQLALSCGKARTLSLDIFDQHQVMDRDGKWRFTSPTHTVLAFHQALKELVQEGGIAARYNRYAQNNHIIRTGMEKLGFAPLIAIENQGPFITTFHYPFPEFSFADFYEYLKENGYAIYPGKISEIDCFRIGNIGEVYPSDMMKVLQLAEEYLVKSNVKGAMAL